MVDITSRLTPSAIGIVFLAIAVIFLAAVIRDLLESEGKLTIERKTWLRLVFIFAGVAVGIHLFEILFF